MEGEECVMVVVGLHVCNNDINVEFGARSRAFSVVFLKAFLGKSMAAPPGLL